MQRFAPIADVLLRLSTWPVVLALGVGTGCGDSVTEPAIDRAVGLYDLVTIGGQPLPVDLSSSFTSRPIVISGTLRLNEQSEWRREFDSLSGQTDVLMGTYVRIGLDSLELVWPDASLSSKGWEDLILGARQARDTLYVGFLTGRDWVFIRR